MKLYAKKINGLAENIQIHCDMCSFDEFEWNSDKYNYELDDKDVSFYDRNIWLFHGMQSVQLNDNSKEIAQHSMEHGKNKVTILLTELL